MNDGFAYLFVPAQAGRDHSVLQRGSTHSNSNQEFLPGMTMSRELLKLHVNSRGSHISTSSPTPRSHERNRHGGVSYLDVAFGAL